MLNCQLWGKRQRWLMAALALALLLLGWQVWRLNQTLSVTIPPDDFAQYWAAGRLGLVGGNFYDTGEMHLIQREAGNKGPNPMMMYGPPYVWPIILPWTLFDYTLSRFLWLAAHVALLLVSVDWLWRFYGGHPRWRWLSWLAAATFVPTLLVIRIGQITPFIFVGVVAFLLCVQRKQWFLAGAAALLIALKPQLFYLFWFVLLLWIIKSRRWQVAVGVGAAGAVALGAVMLFNPAILQQYVAFNISQPPARFAPPTFGMLLRLLFGLEHFWLQFAPAAVGVGWLLLYWRKKRGAWSWAAEMPLLLLVSFSTTAYGWTYDQILLLLPITQMAVWATRWPRRPLIWPHATIYGVIIVLIWYLSSWRIPDFWYFWLAPALLLLYLSMRRQIDEQA